MAKIKNLYDADGSLMYPLAHEKAVIDDTGKTLETKLEEIRRAISDGIGGGSGGSGELVDGSVTTDKIVDGAVTTPKIKHGAITKDRLDPGLSSSIDGAISTATNAYNVASNLSGEVADAKEASEQATEVANSASQAAINVGAAVSNLSKRVDEVEDSMVTSTTLTAMELITQSAYDTKKALGELSDTTAYLITE